MHIVKVTTRCDVVTADLSGSAALVGSVILRCRGNATANASWATTDGMFLADSGESHERHHMCTLIASCGVGPSVLAVLVGRHTSLCVGEFL
jgi:hypothetical protein